MNSIGNRRSPSATRSKYEERIHALWRCSWISFPLIGSFPPGFSCPNKCFPLHQVREAAGLSFMRDRIAEVRSGQAVSSPNLSLLKVTRLCDIHASDYLYHCMYLLCGIQWIGSLTGEQYDYRVQQFSLWIFARICLNSLMGGCCSS